MRLRLEIEIKGHTKCNRLYLVLVSIMKSMPVQNMGSLCHVNRAHLPCLQGFFLCICCTACEVRAALIHFSSLNLWHVSWCNLKIMYGNLRIINGNFSLSSNCTMRF